MDSYYGEELADWAKQNPVLALILGIVLLIVLIAFVVWIFKIQGHLRIRRQ